MAVLLAATVVLVLWAHRVTVELEVLERVEAFQQVRGRRPRH